MKTKQIHLVVEVPEDYDDVDANIAIGDMLKDVNAEYWNWHILEAGEPAAIVENDYNADGLSCKINTYLPAGTNLYIHTSIGE